MRLHDLRHAFASVGRVERMGYRVIIEGFEKELQIARRETPAPVKIRGSKTAPAQITKMHFAGWIAHQIVQLCEIEAWRNTLTTENKPSDADIGRWLFRDSANSRKEVITARKALTSALALVPALSAQISAVTSISEI